MMSPLSPLPLKKGDTIGIIAPSGRLSDTNLFFRGITVLREMGFNVNYPRDLWPGMEYLADSDENRASEFNRLLRAPEVKALICLRGGYGCLRMIDKIDLALVTAHPKMLIGFSDITVLQNYLYQKTGLISLHGPVVTSLGDASKPTRERFFLCLTGRWDEPLEGKKIDVLRNGPTLTAPLVGGNMASLNSILGTPYDFSWDDKIVFLEDINEPAYRVDRMLTQLALAGKFDRLAGLILGEFSGLYPDGSTQHISYLESIWNRVLELCCHADFSIWGNFPSGHCQKNLTLPLGALARLESEKTRLLFPTARTRYVI
ncbi:MAG: LD-carboxypeptidase [Proteobacteria bacterium]|nr:LD-carboxypeptidase [Pseudomonadota bacterium]